MYPTVSYGKTAGIKWHMLPARTLPKIWLKHHTAQVCLIYFLSWEHWLKIDNYSDFSARELLISRITKACGGNVYLCNCPHNNRLPTIPNHIPLPISRTPSGMDETFISEISFRQSMYMMTMLVQKKTGDGRQRTEERWRKAEAKSQNLHTKALLTQISPLRSLRSLRSKWHPFYRVISKSKKMRWVSWSQSLM